MTEKEIVAILKKKVKSEYQPHKCGWTSQRSAGNYDDCFEDGSESGASWVLYEVGCILGMDLTEPEEPNYDE